MIREGRWIDLFSVTLSALLSLPFVSSAGDESNATPSPRPIRFDSVVEIGARTYPTGAYIGARVGAAHVLWGEANRAEGGPHFGYLRLSAEGYSAWSWNQATAALDLAPHGALLFRVGLDREANQKAYRDFDCQIFWCTAQVERRFFETRGAVPIGPLRLVGSFRWDFHRVLEADRAEGRQHLDITSGLPTLPSGDRLQLGSVVLVWPINEYWRLVFLSSHRKVDDADMSSRLTALSINSKLGEQSATLGLGRYESGVLEPGWLVLARWTWSPLQPIGLL